MSVGLNFAKALSLSINKPFIAVNHLEGHALSPKLNKKLDYPYLLLLISGGHSQYLCVNDLGKYKRLGTTIDDALGEAFDKTAKILGVEFPGGPQIEILAKKGDPEKYNLQNESRGFPAWYSPVTEKFTMGNIPIQKVIERLDHAARVWTRLG